MSIIEISELSYSYKHCQALDKVSFSVEKGAVCGLFGPNGSGKTTLFRCMSALLPFEAGSITIDGLDIKKAGRKAIAAKVAYVPQEQQVSFPFTVREVVLMGRTPRMGSVFGPSKKDREAVDLILEQVGIADLADRICNSLSGGQRQLVYIAKAIAQSTPVIFLDEPTSALDFDNQILVWKLLKTISDAGVTVIVCSHDPNHVLWYTTQVVVLYQGHIVTDGVPGEVFDEQVLAMIYQNKCSVENTGGISLIRPVI